MLRAGDAGQPREAFIPSDQPDAKQVVEGGAIRVEIRLHRPPLPRDAIRVNDGAWITPFLPRWRSTPPAMRR